MRTRPVTRTVLSLGLFLLFDLPLLYAQAPPPAIPADVLAEIPGSIILNGGGKAADTARTRFVETAGGEKANLVILFNGEEKEAKQLVETWGTFKAAVLHVQQIRERKKADDADVAKKIAAATGVWIEGDASKMAVNLPGTAVERELHKLLQRGGVCGGDSNTILFGKRIPSGEKGLSLLPSLMIDTPSHQGKPRKAFAEALARQPGLVGLGIAEDTLVGVKGRRLKVSGESATVYLSPSEKRKATVQTLKDKNEADLLALQRAAFLRTQAPFPPEKPATPDVPKGTLVIGGGGGMSQDIVKRFLQFAGGPDALIVVIPTAMEDPLPEEGRISEVRMLKGAGATNIKTLHTRKRSDANSPEFTAILKEAKGVWFSGGRQWKFVDAYENTLAEKLFHEVLKRGGVIGGSSAGASIQSEYMPRGHPLGNLVMMAEGYEQGFGFLPGVAVDQHFFARRRTKDMSDLMKAYPQLLGIGIDEGTVIIVQGTTMEVAGKSKVAVYDRRKPINPDKDYEELQPGDKYDLKKREKVKTE